MNIISIASIIFGMVLLGVSALGAIRLPDFFTRVHAIAVTDTLGVLFILGGLILYYGFNPIAAKLLIIAIFFCLANPTVTHLLTQAALKSGVKPLSKEE